MSKRGKSPVIRFRDGTTPDGWAFRWRRWQRCACEGDPRPRVRVVRGFPESRNPIEKPDRETRTLARIRASIMEGSEAEVENIECKRCGPDKPRLAKPPFRTELGKSIEDQICSNCWAEWLQHQTLLINHYGLDPRDAKAREFLYGQIETVLLGGGKGKEVDTSQQGEIKW